MTETETAEVAVASKGAFAEILKRSNKKIRQDRAEAIEEEAELVYRQEVQKREVKIKRMRREREGMLDLSPTTADSLTLANDFDAEVFTKKDINLGVQIREEMIRLEVARQRYIELFGEGVV